MTMLPVIRVCPLCGSSQKRFHSTPVANLYSEALARLTGMVEADLLAQVSNVFCLECGLVYKQKWVPKEIIQQLFSEAVPDHPRGWDVGSERFSADGFARELAVFRQSLDRLEAESISRCRRSLTSIVDAIPQLAGRDESRRLRTAIQAGDTTLLQEAIPLLRAVMGSPAPYGRFSGFSSSGLWDYLETKLGGIRAYAEVGCPLWGLLRHAQALGRQACFLRRAEPNYWASGCRRDGVHCVDHLVAGTGIETADWDGCRSGRFDLIGAFQYLDHLDAPGRFLDAVFARADAAALILDAGDMPVAIQHLTGWTSEPMIWLAKRHRCHLESDFAEIRPSGNQLFLLVRSK